VGPAARAFDRWIADPDDPRRRLPHGTRGEIVIAGPQVATGYLEAAAAGPSPFFAFPDGRRAYRTGDLGSIDPDDGSIACAGRLDGQIKLHGYRLELEEIEAHLRVVPGVSDGAVLAIDRDGQPDHLVAGGVGAPPPPPAPPGGGRAPPPPRPLGPAGRWQAAHHARPHRPGRVTPGLRPPAPRAARAGAAADQQWQGRPARPPRDAGVTPYVDLHYFLFLLYPLAAVVVLGLLGLLRRPVVLLASVAILLFHYRDPLGRAP